PAVIGTLFDITDRKEAEEERVKLCEQRIVEEKRHLMEKEKLLMDLHDGIGGITTNIGILAELAQKAPDIDVIKKTLAIISRLSREGVSEIRSFMHSLDTKELSWRTLAAELRSQGTSMVEPHNIRFTADTSVEDIEDQPGSLLWANLFKIYKEALTNIIKHAKAQSVAVTLTVAGNGISLSIQDDGTGWKEKLGSGRGVANMQKRAKEIGGTVTLSAGGGTRVMLEIPIPLKYPVSGME
ncbi:MAG TPA: ATP-binding protein, partial [Nitrospirota bacterium]